MDRMAIAALFFLVLPAVSSLSDEGRALLVMKASFTNFANLLLDWNPSSAAGADALEDHCSWRGVLCANLTPTVFSLFVSPPSPLLCPAKCVFTNRDLKGNRLHGQIPDEIGECVSLKYLDLSGNSLSGDIPFALSKLKQLEELCVNLKSNQLSGPIPSTLSQIPNLKTLDLAQNQFTGDIPRLIYWNEVLQYLGLRGNSLTGTLSPDVCQLTGLWYFDVRGNNLTGTIPENIGNCTSFEILDISYNEITGEIPYNIGFLQVATLSLQGNRLTGKIPEVIGLMQALAVLYLHGNKLTGAIPPELGNMSKLSYLQLNDNYLDGFIPAELGKLEDLFELNFANNKLEGPIPKNITSCSFLNKLNVHGNLLNGSIPLEFQKLESLTYLIDMMFSSLIISFYRDLSGNNFSGLIPDSIGDLEHLLVFDLSYNKLSGFIPEELGQLQNIDALDLSFNNLSGEIPSAKNFSRFPSGSFTGNPLLCGNWPDSFCASNGHASKVIISPVAAVCITLGFMILILMIMLAIYKSNQPKVFTGPLKTAEDSLKLVVLHMDLAIHTYEDIMRSTENLNEKYIIGHGASSTVYKCVLKNSRPIAIKRLYTQYPHNLREFETELETVGSIRHRNLVTLHGYSLSPHGNLLFYDYMQNGSLWDLLHGPSKKVKLDWDTRLKIAVGAAQGLAYLHHDCDPKIIHRDVKSSNILLDDNFEAHLSDFGIAKCIPCAKTHSSTFVMGTIGYIDPEYARTSRLTEKSDVYSFGIVLLELLTGKKAVDNESNLHQLILSKADDNTVMEAVDSEVSVTCMDLGLVKKAFQLALLCTKRHPSDRPSMHEVSRVLVSLMPVPSLKPCLLPLKEKDYTKIIDDNTAEKKTKGNDDHDEQYSSSSDGQWFVKFGEVISKNTL
ncbi:LRR receptor-like serine/threonine-protein kinase ERL1 [Apostasia shenzhenica]|uniref:LRR receptor-like serine/threonine-protein kinase ERL1 n=1 Tax=Apostasia shenzhenica TaxID=1088818 RepID=A0A2I0AWT2_9ASPA|nr:LRR receptor-like serine/threonine-protein kinase ERL1 [Apostasia shenzhenica]